MRPTDEFHDCKLCGIVIRSAQMIVEMQIMKPFLQWLLIILTLLIHITTTTTVRATPSDTPFYLFYFETVDVLLQTGETAQYKFDAFRGEEVTIAIYGLDELVLPQITLYNNDGEIVATGRYTPEQPYITSIQFTVSQDESFTFEVTAIVAADGGGLARVMVVEGDPIAGDLTYLDTLNPLLPGRVFMVAGSDEIDEDISPIESGRRVSVEVLPVERFRDKPDVFVSRGSSDFLPPIEERFSPATSHTWFNEDGTAVYFFTIHPVPEQVTSAVVNAAIEFTSLDYISLELNTFYYFDYFFVIGAGSDPIRFSISSMCCGCGCD